MYKLWWLPVLIVGMLAVALIALASVASANHSWGKYHWARTGNSFTLKLETDLTGAWLTGPSPGYLSVASNDWSVNNKPKTTVVYESTSLNCPVILGKVRVCNAAYGDNGWLGIAQIWTYVGGGKPVHIAQALVKLNDTYFDTVTYNTPAWRQFVMCQEVGHTFGLDHQNVTYDTPNLGSCMDYTSSPAGPPSNEHPNQHDYSQMATIYGHTDSFNSPTAFAGMPVPRSGAHNDDDFGTPTGEKDSKGRNILFVKPVGEGQKLYTWVIWAGEHGKPDKP